MVQKYQLQISMQILLILAANTDSSINHIKHKINIKLDAFMKLDCMLMKLLVVAEHGALKNNMLCTFTN
jgi:hypothetical protein